MVRSTLLSLVMLLSLGLLTCAKPYTPHVIGGQDAKVGAWPWMASINKLGRHLCGGVLIKPKIVLTSANCADRIRSLPNTVVVLGLHDQLDANVGKPEVIKLEAVIKHENWGEITLNNDIAILKLTRPASNSSFIKPIALPGKELDLTNKVCTFAGWGSSDITDQVALTPVLQEKALKVWPDEICRSLWPANDINGQLNCGSNPKTGSSGVCRLDTGGPLSCPVDGDYVLGGISVVLTASCAEASPALFTNIPSYIDWINKNSA